jgi:hypothetical protein
MSDAGGFFTDQNVTTFGRFQNLSFRQSKTTSSFRTISVLSRTDDDRMNGINTNEGREVSAASIQLSCIDQTWSQQGNTISSMIRDNIPGVLRVWRFE